jgi:hypothetical protein
VTHPATKEYVEIMELNMHPRLKVPEIITSLEGKGTQVKVKLSDVTEKI